MRKNMKRFLTAALCTATLGLTGGALATADFTASAATTTPTLTFEGAVLVIDSNVDVWFAVSTENLDESATVELLVWNEPQTDYTYNADNAYAQVGTTTNEEGVECRTFPYDQLALKQMADGFYVCAYTNVNGIGYYSEVKKYSILQYAHNMIEKGSAENAEDKYKNQVPVIKAMLELGAQMQILKKYNTDFLANAANLVDVTIDNAVFEDGFSYGIYPAKGQFEVTAKPGYQLAEDASSAFQVDEETGAIMFTVPEGEASVHYQTSFVSIPASEGLEYTFNDDGASYSVSVGTCTETEIIIPAVYESLPVTAIGAEAFKDQTAIISVSIPSSVTTIGTNAFAGCSSLTEVTIPNGVKTIETMAFAASGLKTVNVSASVTSIANNAFYNNQSLTNINVDASNQTYLSSNGDLYTKNGSTLIAYAIGKEDTSFTVPAAVTTIGENAFYNAANLTEIDLNDNVTALGAYAFQNCTGLKFVGIPEKIVAIGKNTFDACSGLESVYIPVSVLAVADYAFDNCTALKGIYYDGTASNWSSIGISATGNTALTNATKYYYGETTYALASTLGMGTNGAINEEHTLDSTAKIIASGCFVAYSIQMYAGGNVVISSTNVIGSIMFRSSGANTMNVYGSVDGITWTEAPIQTLTTASGAGAYTVKVPTYSYKYLKLATTGSTTVAITELTLGTYSA